MLGIQNDESKPARFKMYIESLEKGKLTQDQRHN